MCWFITAVVPPDTDLAKSKSLLENYGMSFKDIRNSFVEAQLAGDRFLRATRSTCDCSSALGSAAQLQDIEQQSHAYLDEIDKLRKKGWSQHRIDRWLVEKSGSADRRLSHKNSQFDAELQRWSEFIASLLSDGIASRLGIMLHMYNGKLEDEKIQIKRTERLSLSAQLAHQLLAIEEDVLYMISK